MWFGQSLAEVDLRGLTALVQLYDRVAERAAALASDAFVIGAGYDDTAIGGHPHPGAVKIFLDGSLVARTAAMVEPFCDRHSHGYFQSDPDAMRELIVSAHATGWQVAAHAIGDRAVDLALDVFAQAQARHARPEVRHRIEHAAVTATEQVGRMAALGVTPVPQARFLAEIGDTMAAAVGPDRVDRLTGTRASCVPVCGCRAAQIARWHQARRCWVCSRWRSGSRRAAR